MTTTEPVNGNSNCCNSSVRTWVGKRLICDNCGSECITIKLKNAHAHFVMNVLDGMKPEVAHDLLLSALNEL